MKFTLALGLVLGGSLLAITGAQARPADRIDRHPVPVCPDPQMSTDGNAAIAAGSDGTLIVVWTRKLFGAPSLAQVWGCLFKADSYPEGKPFQVAASVSDTPLVAIDAAGRFVVAWIERVNWWDAEAPIVARRFDQAAVAQGEPFPVTVGHLSHYLSRPKIAMNASGDFVVAWSAYDLDMDGNQALSVFARAFDPTGRPRGGEWRASPPTNQWHWDEGALAMNASGELVAVILRIQPEADGQNHYTIVGRMFDKTGIAKGLYFPVAGAITPDVTRSVTVANDAGGNVVVMYSRDRWLWPLDAMESIGIFMRRFNSFGTPLQVEQRVSAPGVVGHRRNLSLAMQADGDFAASWTSTPHVQMRLYSSSGKAITRERTFFGHAVAVTDSTTAINGFGDFTLLWSQANDARIRVQRFAGPDDERPGCGYFIASMVGTPGDDVLWGTSAGDVITGLSGNDFVHGASGPDVICGGGGSDQLFGGDDADRLLGGLGDDVMDGGPGRDVCRGHEQENADTATSCETTSGVP